MSEQSEQLTSMLDGLNELNTADSLALRAAVEEKLAREREKIEALASALGGSCSFQNDLQRKKGKRSNAKHDE